ncbi:MAG: ATP-binding cassette domain-containing protein [Clostridiales bacterium]|nr:ATP-binding cassette domain-containing protein [Clostridiales bacterium]
MNIIDVSHLTFSYKKNNSYNRVLTDLNLQIKEGEFVCIIGHSGCGKSTLLNILAGLLLPDSGNLLIEGKALTGPGTERAIVFQHYSLFPWMTAYKNVLFGIQQARSELSKSEAGELARVYIRKVGLEDNVKRVAIARALAMDSKILLLDEPFSALDAKNRNELQQLLEYLLDTNGNRKTVVFVTHDIEEAILLADRILFMRQGRFEAEFTVPFSRPRNRENTLSSSEYKKLKTKLIDLFYFDSELETNEDF